MTYSELLRSLTFDEIAPTLKKYLHPDESLMWYRLHFDMLRLMTPIENLKSCREGESAIVRVSCCDRDGEELPDGFLDAFSLECDTWEVSLAKELVIEENVKASMAEIAACCIWHSSFYGFTKQEPDFLYTPWHDEYKRIKGKYGKWIPSEKKMMQTNRLLRNCVKREMRRQRRRNNFKLDYVRGCKPYKWRHCKRLEVHNQYYDMVNRIGRFVERLTEYGRPLIQPGSADELFSKLFNNSSFHIDNIPTFTGDVRKRVDYVQELLEVYDDLKNGSGYKGIFCFYMSSEYPLTMEELSRLNDLLFRNVESLVWGIRIDDALGKEIRIDYAVHK